MFLTVHYNYGGNWTALYLIGPRTPVPPGIPAERLYIFPNNTGYDGQSFHVMAHDPWMRRSTPAAVEIEPFRYARILVPAIAWMLALGHDPWIEPAYFTTILAFVFLGVFWMAAFALRLHLHPAWGLDVPVVAGHADVARPHDRRCRAGGAVRCLGALL